MLLAFAVLASWLHLALLGAVDAGFGGSGGAAIGDRPVLATPLLTVRTIAIEPAPPSIATPAPAAAPTAEPVGTAVTAPTSAHAVAGPAPAAAKISPAAEAMASVDPVELQPEKASASSPAMQDSVTTWLEPPVTATAADSDPAPLSASSEPPAARVSDTVVAGEPAADVGMLKVALEGQRAMESFLAAGERPPPTYRTVLPAPATLKYDLRRGLLRGSGEIRWRPAGDRYALQFEARLAGLLLLAQSSQGELAATGLAPVRFLEQRARKSARSVNFSRDSGTISFSASTLQWPLLAGTQDRLSWMIQLGAIVAADPALPGSGRISMVLVSARGEAGVRTARFAGRENAETASGSVPALKFVVDGHSAYDGSFEIWLDPARGYLPARAVSRSSAGDAEFELLLQRADP